MDNEITINGEVYVKKNSKIQEKLKKFGKMWVEEYCEKPWPQEGDAYFFIDTIGRVIKDKYTEKKDEYNLNKWIKKRREFGNFFQTKEEAEMYSLRIESLSKGFMPEDGEEFWEWDFDDSKPIKWSSVLFSTFINPKFPTREECQVWYDKYGASWLALLNDKK